MNSNKIFILLSLLVLVVVFINIQGQIINAKPKSKKSKRGEHIDVDPILELEFNKLNDDTDNESNFDESSYTESEWSSDSEESEDSNITYPST